MRHILQSAAAGGANPAAAGAGAEGARTRAWRQRDDLVVEDEEPLRGLIRTILESYGYCVEASSGVGALQVWHEHKEQIDLLFTDMVMPDAMTGRELAERLQAEKPNLQVLFTTGYSEELTEGELVLEEGKHFLQKPYHPIKLARNRSRRLDESESPSGVKARAG